MSNRLVLQTVGAALATLLLASCHRAVYEDLSHCPQGVDFGLYVQTPCDAAPKYPSEITEAHIFAFDEAGKLVRDITAKDLKPAPDFTLRTDFYRVGKSDFIVWAGADLSAFDFGSFVPGTTTREQLLVSLKSQAQEVSSRHTGLIPVVYVGKPVDGPLTQEDRSALGTSYDKVSIRLTRLTNRLHLTFKGLDPKHSYTVHVEDETSRYTIDGSFAKGETIKFLPDDLKQLDRTLTATIDVMRLDRGRHATLVLTDSTTGEEVMRKNLIEELLFAPAENEASRPYNLDCQHDFDIEIDFKLDLGNYMKATIIINQWNLVFRHVILE